MWVAPRRFLHQCQGAVWAGWSLKDGEPSMGQAAGHVLSCQSLSQCRGWWAEWWQQQLLLALRQWQGKCTMAVWSGLHPFGSLSPKMAAGQILWAFLIPVLCLCHIFCLNYSHALGNSVRSHCQSRCALLLVVLSLGCLSADFLPFSSLSASPAFILSLLVPLVCVSPACCILLSHSFCFCFYAASFPWLSALFIPAFSLCLSSLKRKVGLAGSRLGGLLWS